MATKITYTQQGDYLLPDLKLPEQPKVEIGIWGKPHLEPIRKLLFMNGNNFSPDNDSTSKMNES